IPLLNATCLCILSSTRFFYVSGHLPDLHSFPTRRSSDLRRPRPAVPAEDHGRGHVVGHPPARRRRVRAAPGRVEPRHPVPHHQRSEEHTSELQSLRHLVCRLLLEKKKNQANISFKATTVQ